MWRGIEKPLEIMKNERWIHIRSAETMNPRFKLQNLGFVLLEVLLFTLEKTVKDRLRLLHFPDGEGAELHIHGIIREVGNELVVGSAALFGGLGGGVGEGAAEDAGADEGEGDAVQAIVLEDTQGIVVGVEQLLESLGGSAKVGADCVDDVSGVGHVKGGGDDCGTVFQGSLVFGTRSGQGGHAGFFEDHAADSSAGPKTTVCSIDNGVDNLIGAGGVD